MIARAFGPPAHLDPRNLGLMDMGE